MDGYRFYASVLCLLATFIYDASIAFFYVKWHENAFVGWKSKADVKTNKSNVIDSYKYELILKLRFVLILYDNSFVKWNL